MIGGRSINGADALFLALKTIREKEKIK